MRSGVAQQQNDEKSEAEKNTQQGGNGEGTQGGGEGGELAVENSDRCVECRDRGIQRRDFMREKLKGGAVVRQRGLQVCVGLGELGDAGGGLVAGFATGTACEDAFQQGRKPVKQWKKTAQKGEKFEPAHTVEFTYVLA